MKGTELYKKKKRNILGVKAVIELDSNKAA